MARPAGRDLELLVVQRSGANGAIQREGVDTLVRVAVGALETAGQHRKAVTTFLGDEQVEADLHGAAADDCLVVKPPRQRWQVPVGHARSVLDADGPGPGCRAFAMREYARLSGRIHPAQVRPESRGGGVQPEPRRIAKLPGCRALDESRFEVVRDDDPRLGDRGGEEEQGWQ